MKNRFVEVYLTLNYLTTVWSRSASQCREVALGPPARVLCRLLSLFCVHCRVTTLGVLFSMVSGVMSTDTSTNNITCFTKTFILLLSFWSSINACCLASCSHIVEPILIVSPTNKYEKNELNFHCDQIVRSVPQLWENTLCYLVGNNLWRHLQLHWNKAGVLFPTMCREWLRCQHS